MRNQFRTTRNVLLIAVALSLLILNSIAQAYWDGKDNSGEKAASGVYFYTLQAGDFSATRKMVIMK